MFWQKKKSEQIPRQRRQLREPLDYLILPDPNDEQQYLVRIEDGPYCGVIFKYDKIQIHEEKDHARISFTYTIIRDNDIILNRTDFHDHLSDILDSIIESLPSDAISINIED